jgi:hypothetical protein
MVGLEGCGPDRVVQTIRVKAVNPFYPNLIMREFDLTPKANGYKWEVGDEVGLHGGVWTERNDAKVYAIITEIIHV